MYSVPAYSMCLVGFGFRNVTMFYILRFCTHEENIIIVFSTNNWVIQTLWFTVIQIEWQLKKKLPSFVIASASLTSLSSRTLCLQLSHVMVRAIRKHINSYCQQKCMCIVLCIQSVTVDFYPLWKIRVANPCWSCASVISTWWRWSFDDNKKKLLQQSIVWQKLILHFIHTHTHKT